MTFLTFRVIDGPDRGAEFNDLPTPVSIGREDGNSIRLNDDRVSRYHVKIQDDQNKMVMTDLDSTNGSRVNGESASLWILRPGDLLSLGRTTLLFGSREQIAARLAHLRGVAVSPNMGIPLDTEDLEEMQDDPASSFSIDQEFSFTAMPDAREILHRLLPPDLPTFSSPAEAATVSEMITYFHFRIRNFVRQVEEHNVSLREAVEKLEKEEGASDGKKGEVKKNTFAKISPEDINLELMQRQLSNGLVMEQRHWQNMLDLEDLLAKYLEKIGDPEV